MRDEYPPDKPVYNTRVVSDPRPQHHFDNDSDNFRSNNRGGACNPRSWRKRVWVGIGIAAVIVLILAIVPAVVISNNKANNSYPDYSPINYTLSETYGTDEFFDKFDYFTGYDPTKGLVHYVPQPQAEQLNLTYASTERAILRVDTSVGPDSTPDASTGRFSVRITSKNTYDNGLFLFDVRHAPVGCATWPALWLSDPNNWPDHGEIDIMEAMNPPAANQISAADAPKANVHDGSTNLMTLHTSKGCTMKSVRREQLGESLQGDCNHLVNDNAGCGVATRDQIGGGNSYGPNFNTAGGAVVALEVRDAGIRLWQFARGSSNMPADIANFAANVNGNGNNRVEPDPSGWGTASADFPSTDCDIGNHFRNQSIIINVTICGEAVYGSWEDSGCPMSTCEKFQAENPQAFREAYWEFGGFEVYKPK